MKIIIVDTPGDNDTAEQSIDGIGERVLLERVVPEVMAKNPELKTPADAMVKLISKLLKEYCRQHANLWDD